MEQEPAPEAVFWWEFKNSDCGYDDIEEQCVGDTLGTCKLKCAANPLCGGFNFPHGIMKKRDCLSKKAASTVDLYVLHSTCLFSVPKQFPDVAAC